MKPDDIITNDLEAIDSQIDLDWLALDNSRIFITGGTGFIGSWIIESFRYASHKGRRFELIVLSRDPEKFALAKPHLANWPYLKVIQGDVKNVNIIDGEVDYIIHAATESSAALNQESPLEMFDTVVNGTRRLLDIAVQKSIRRLLFLSSGAVYGLQPREITHVHETCNSSPDVTNPVNTYAESKRAAEILCAIYSKHYSIPITTARIFAVLGPHLNLDSHFAAGNFIRNAMQGDEITIQGDGRPCRSYIYITDLVTGLLRMLARGPAGEVFNLGSEQSTTIAGLAEAVTSVMGGSYRILGKPDTGWNPGRYVPSMNKFHAEFGALGGIGLEEAIWRTAIWNGWKP